MVLSKDRGYNAGIFSALYPAFQNQSRKTCRNILNELSDARAELAISTKKRAKLAVF